MPLDDHLKGYVSDCPVQPDVWRRYREDGPGTTQTLIAQVRPGDSPPMVATKLRDWFDARELITHANYVLVEANFDEMVTRLLPLTGWSNFVRRAAALTLARLRAEVAEVSAVQGSHRLAEGLNSSKEDWGAEDRARLRWLVSMIVMTDGLGDEGSTSVDLDTRVTHLLREASDAASSEFAPLAAVGFNRPVRPAVAQSRVAVKADAAERVFNVDCCAITWAVVDTGIARNHPAFAGDDGKSRVVHTFDVGAGIEHLKDKQKDARFVALLDDQAWEIFRDGALVTGENADRGRSVDARTEHGTHVAGILGAKYERPARPPRSKPGEDTPDGDLFGICPTIRLVDVRVFDEDETGSEFNVLVALAFIRWLNERQRLGPDGRIDGVNISLSVPFAVDSHACGWTPVCQECDRLVKSGVVVVVAAGNAGFVEGQDESLGTGFALVSIADPGNAEAVITVGATHSTEPHRYGPMARSARGPTADGRHKPDLLAPGSRILGPAPAGRWQRMSGTSMAAPHVSGVAAMLLARFPELRGQPERVKDILCETATDLGRLPDFQGHGLLDALRALQSE